MLSKIELSCQKRIEKAIIAGQKKFLNCYDYSEVSINARWDEKVKIRCAKHNFALKRTFSAHLNSPFGGCKTCFRELKFKSFLEQCAQIHGAKYDYSRVIYTKSQNKVEIICHIHGSFFQSPISHLNQNGCQKCSFNERVRNQYDDKESFIEKARAFHGDKYNYDSVEYISSKRKVKIGCKIHGIFEQMPCCHLKGGCKHCRDTQTGISQRKTTEEFIRQCNKIHKGKYDYSKTVYICNREDVEIVCSKHGPFYQTASAHSSGHGCSKCSVHASSQEDCLEQILNKIKIPFRARVRRLIPPSELDFYIPERKVAIECNGLLWHSEFPFTGNGKNKDYHLSKTSKCKDIGVKLFHFLETDVKFRTQIVKSLLNRYFGTYKYSISSDKCEIKEIPTQLKSRFLNKYDLSGNCKSDFNLGVFYKERLIGVVAMRTNKKIKILRLSETFNFKVKDLFQFIVSYLKASNYKVIQVKLSNNWPRTDIPLDSFLVKSNLPPKCFYHRNECCKNMKLLSEGQFISKLTKLGKYDKLLTVAENCVNNKWNRIWDTGSTIYEKDL